ncbi:MAG: glycosyltransferase [Bacteroidota bacterium]
MIKPVKIYVALPVMEEFDYLPQCIDAIRAQDYRNFEVIICLNQPDEWYTLPEKKHVCVDNLKTLGYLRQVKDFDLKVIDRSSPGKGWKGKRSGVGWARKTAMDEIAEVAEDRDIILCLDADTIFPENYFSSVVNTFTENPHISALSVPYFHRLTGDETLDRAMLHYEIYMRNYALNMLRIKSPYAFTAIGSAMATTAKVYRAVKGIAPKPSGEDFYFLMKLRKHGKVISHNPVKVYPATRYSDRVFFGTGPALIKGVQGDWESYPMYHYYYFDEVAETTDAFGTLFEKEVPTPMTLFLQRILKEDILWKPLRKNHKTKERFIRACHEKVDALRILQFLKYRQRLKHSSDEVNLREFLYTFYAPELRAARIALADLDFNKSSIEYLDKLRRMMMEIEETVHSGKRT